MRDTPRNVHLSIIYMIFISLLHELIPYEIFLTLKSYLTTRKHTLHMKKFYNIFNLIVLL